jgi:hypothetical protein
MDLHTWRREIRTKERLMGGRRLMNERRAFNRALRAGGHDAWFEKQTHLTTTKELAKWVQQHDDAVVLVPWKDCGACRAAIEWMNQHHSEMGEIPFAAIERSVMDDIQFETTHNTTHNIAESVRWFPTLLFFYKHNNTVKFFNQQFVEDLLNIKLQGNYKDLPKTIKQFKEKMKHQ